MEYYSTILTQLRRQEQEIRGYATSSRWYTSLSNAISFLQRAETATDPLERFYDIWSAAYNLFMMFGKPGDEEYKRFNSWVTELKEIPAVRLILTNKPESNLFLTFQTDIDNAKGKLLTIQSIQELQVWKEKTPSPDKACRYFLAIIRDIRNRCSHPDFSPSSTAIKKALTSAANCMVPIVVAAIRTIIERPVDGTTGKTTAYRSFLWPFLRNSDSFFSDYYLERLFPEEELESLPDAVIDNLLKEFVKAFRTKTPDLLKADSDKTKSQWCVPILFQVLNLKGYENVKLVSGDAVFEPSFSIKKDDISGSPRSEYQGKDAGRDLSCLIWILPWRSNLDTLSSEPSFESLPVMEMAHRALTNSDVPWALISNGRQFRLLARGTAHRPRCFLEMDLDAIGDRYSTQEARLAFRYFVGLFSGPSFSNRNKNNQTLLERVLAGSERHGKEIGDELKQNVFNALEELGDGFLHFLKTNPEAIEVIRQEVSPPLSTQEFLLSGKLLNEIYTESLSLMYRLLFLFYAESRNLLPMDNDMYRETYSLESIRDDIISVHDDPDPKRFFSQGDTHLWERLKELSEFVNRGWRKIIPVYNGGLFDTELHEFLERCKVPDYFLTRAIDLLSRTKPRSGQIRGEGRKKVTYRDLDVRHLGSIYEGILEYSAHIAKQDMIIIKRGTGSKVYEEYATVDDLNKEEKQHLKVWKEAIEENPDNPKIPRGCNVNGLKEKGRYFLVYGGRESKRKSSGSYYTPDYIVQYIVENTLGPLIRGECRPAPEPIPESLLKLALPAKEILTGPLSSDEILKLKVLDPAMGSGHFLIAATEYIARAYGVALVREGNKTDGVVSDEDFIRYKRMIAERCIYGVDINPMAVELAKLSMWLFTMDQGRPLSFLNHHLKCGNALIGAWIDDLGELPNLDKKGKSKKKIAKVKQLNLFEGQFRAKVPIMIRDLFGIMEQETLTYEDIKGKKALEKAVEEIKRPFKNIADAWVAAYFGEEPKNYDALLSNVTKANRLISPAAEHNKFFHWQLEFPEVWFDKAGKSVEINAGFSAIIGNPPYLTFGGKWTGKKNELMDNALRQLFIESAEYKLNMYLLFKELGIRLLRDRGFISLVVPDSYLLGYYSYKIRSFILKHCRINSLSVLFFDPWDSGDVGRTVIFLYSKDRNILDDFKTKIIKIDNESMHPTSVHIMNEGSFRKENRLKFQIFFSRDDEDFFRLMQTLPNKAEDYFDFHTALRSRIPKNKVLEMATKGKYKLKPCMMQGEDIYRFIVTDNKVMIPIEKTLYWGGYDWDQYKSPKIFIRKTGDTIIAAIDRNNLLCFDNLHVIRQKEGFNILEIAVSWFNSEILNRFYKLASMEEGRTMAQLDIDTLKSLPFPNLADINDSKSNKCFARIKSLVLCYEADVKRVDIKEKLELEWDRLLSSDPQ